MVRTMISPSLHTSPLPLPPYLPPPPSPTSPPPPIDAPIQPGVTQVRSVGPSSLEVSWTYKGFLNNLLEYQLEVS